MSLAVEGMLLLLAVLLGARGRPRGGRVVVVVALAWLLAVGLWPLPQWLAGRLQDAYPSQVQAPWAARNAIVLLGAGTALVPGGGVETPSVAYGRITRVAILYGACHRTGADCKVLVSGGDPLHHGQAEADVYAAVLRGLGVPATDLIIERRSNTTWQNAEYSRPLLQAYRPQRLLLVSSGIHLRRSVLYFAHFGLHPQPIRGDYLHALHAWLPMAANAALFDASLHEYLGIARYYVYNALGWNAPKMPTLATTPQE
jgi:uncharacterized SAM-binding protein YcdF (DUF218 family)